MRYRFQHYDDGHIGYDVTLTHQCLICASSFCFRFPTLAVPLFDAVYPVAIVLYCIVLYCINLLSSWFL